MAETPPGHNRFHSLTNLEAVRIPLFYQTDRRTMGAENQLDIISDLSREL